MIQSRIEALTAIDASTASILNALSPLFASLVAAVWIRDPLTPAKLAGIALCIVGTAVLVGWVPKPMTDRELLAASFSVLATLVYGITSVFTLVGGTIVYGTRGRPGRPIRGGVTTCAYVSRIAARRHQLFCDQHVERLLRPPPVHLVGL